MSYRDMFLIAYTVYCVLAFIALMAYHWKRSGRADAEFFGLTEEENEFANLAAKEIEAMEDELILNELRKSQGINILDMDNSEISKAAHGGETIQISTRPILPIK